MKRIKEVFIQLKNIAKHKWFNKYTIVLVCFIVWVLVFDKYSFMTHRALSQSINNLENEQIDYEERIIETRRQLVELEKNKEKYAREKYFMHKPNEEIIVINTEEK